MPVWSEALSLVQLKKFSMKRYSFPFFFILVTFFYTKVTAQTFYVNTLKDPFDNKTYQINVQTCDTVQLFTCSPTNDTLQYFENVYDDIAIDGNQNLYYASALGSVYRRSLTNNACQFVGTFGHNINALVADRNGDLLAAGNENDVCTLYKFTVATNSFTTLGNFPPSFFSSGDLFFYEDKLFLTANNADFTNSFLVQVNLSNPSQSCYYMNLHNLYPYAAFTLNDGTPKAYLISTGARGSVFTSTLYEINLSARTLSTALCTFPFQIMGAASIYISLPTINPDCSALPIELIKFNYNIQNEMIELVWQTDLELGNDYFVIEKSTDGKYFQPLGRRNGAGNSDITHRYSFIDSTPSLKNFYRLKQVDLDGKYTYSHILFVNFPLIKQFTILANPTRNG